MAQHDEQIEPLSDTILPDAQIEQLVGVGQSLIEQAGVFLTTMFRTWNLYQIAIAVGLFAVAHVLRVIFGLRIRSWMAARDYWPKGRMRILVAIHQRLRPICFFILIWFAVGLSL